MTIPLTAVVAAHSRAAERRTIWVDPAHIVGAEVAWDDDGEPVVRLPNAPIVPTALGAAVRLELEPAHPEYGPSQVVLVEDGWWGPGGGGPAPAPVDPAPVDAVAA